LHRQVLASKRRVLKEDHPSTTITMLSLATVLVDLKRYDEAEALTREAYTCRNRVSGPDDLNTLIALNNLGYILNLQNKPAEAEEVFRDVIERRRRVLGELHEYTVATEFNLLRTLVAQKKYGEADKLMDVVQRPEAFKKLSPDQQGLVLYMRGVRLMEQDRAAQAEPLFVDALKHLRSSNYPTAENIQRVLRAQVDLYEKMGRAEDAAKARAELSPATRPASQRAN
jgi:tetratricopeptide (TPR) repeat protein